MANFQEITDIQGHSGRHPGGNIHRIVAGPATAGGGRSISGSWVMYDDSGISEQEHKLLLEPFNHRRVKSRSRELQPNFLQLRRNPTAPPPEFQNPFVSSRVFSGGFVLSLLRDWVTEGRCDTLGCLPHAKERGLVFWCRCPASLPVLSCQPLVGAEQV